MHILQIVAASEMKVELSQPHDGSTYIELLKIFFSWPVVILFIFLMMLYKSGDSLKTFLQNLGEFTFKAGGTELSAKRQQIEAAAALGAASAARQTTGPDQQPPPDEFTLRQVAQVVSEASRPTIARRLDGASILWVDDRPSNNVYERKSLEALGVHFILTTSTEDALAKIRENHFDVIISDMGRPPDPKAGYTLLDQLRRAGVDTPFIVYAGSNAQKHRDEAKRHGALGSTNNPQELFQLVTAALGRRAA